MRKKTNINIFEGCKGTNKHESYNGVYEDAFCNLYPEDIKLVFEIGVNAGGSSRGFKRYFPNALIVGIEIDPKWKFSEDRIVVEIGSGSDADFVNSLISKYGEPDIVIDDGSHFSTDIKKSFNILYDRTKYCYVIEDYGVQYKSYENGYYINDNIPATNIMFDKINELMVSRSMSSIKIYHSICFFFK